MKIILLVATFFSLSLTAQARCVAGDCQDGIGKAKFYNGDTYAGAWADGLMHGDGVYTYKSGAEYRGSFRNGKIDGKGTVRYPDGAYYVGQWRNNRKHGEGRLVRPSGKTESGRWADGKRIATGVASTANAPSIRPAKPTSPAANTSANGIRNCNTLFCADGFGRYTYRDGTVYEGDFEEGKPVGEGTVRYTNGDVYTGGWDESAPDGNGAYVFVNGQSVSGKWANGKLVRRTYSETERIEVAHDAATNKLADGVATMYAVVVGIGTYDAMQTLRFTDDDAYQMYAFLKSPEGGALADDQVEILVDERATRVNIERALAQKLGQADADDIVVFYYSGHGVDGYFVPVDFDGANNLLSHQRVTQLLESSAAKHKLVLADACHSGGLLAARSSASSSARLYDAFAKTRGGTALMLSSHSTEVSLEAQNLRSGVFSHYLLRGMKGEADANGNKVVTVKELHNYLYGRVRSYTGKRQTPVLTGTFDEEMPVATLR